MQHDGSSTEIYSAPPDSTARLQKIEQDIEDLKDWTMMPKDGEMADNDAVRPAAKYGRAIGVGVGAIVMILPYLKEVWNFWTGMF